jgi:hypothetical protein
MLRSRIRLVTTIASGLLVLALFASAPALAALPRTYTSQPIENPLAQTSDRFGDGFVNTGDVDGDGEDDLLVGIDEHGTIEGKVHVFSGETRAEVMRIMPPDPSTAGRPAAFGTFVGKVEDLGTCPGFSGSPGDTCTAATVGAPTGEKPDFLVGAVGVDRPGQTDTGMVYAIDGETGAVLKRILMPAADRAEQGAVPTSVKSDPRTGFGGTVLAPSALPPCAGNGGVGACASVTADIRRGDLDGGGRADIVVGARSYHESNPATNPACDPGPCTEAGRFYVYRGESIAGSNPATDYDTAIQTIKNPMAQSDDPAQPAHTYREAMGYSVAPLGDVGRCNDATPTPGDYCRSVPPGPTPPQTDGVPDWVASSHRVDMFGMFDTGVAFVIDGRTGEIINLHRHPEPQSSSIFAFSNYNQPAPGDLASSTLPDSYQSAMVQNGQYRAQGKGWVMRGDQFGGANHAYLSVLNDPTPNKIGNFGTSSAGIGNVSGDDRNEMMIGAYGPHAPQVIDDVISDVHIFSPLTDQALQTIPDPEQQPGSGFGRVVMPMGDLNDDTFLDYAVGAGGYDPGQSVICSPCTGNNPAQGRIYLMLSDNSPAPPSGGSGGGTQSNPTVLAGRTLELAASRERVRRGRRIILRGALEAFANQAACEGNEDVELQRRTPTQARYRTFAHVTTTSGGDFSASTRPGRTYVYRARVGQTSECLGAVSGRERVDVLRRR